MGCEYFAFIFYQVEDLVSRLQGVAVTFEPRDLDVSLQVPLNSEGENRYSWSLRICYEVRLKTGLSRTKQVKCFPQILCFAADVDHIFIFKSVKSTN